MVIEPLTDPDETAVDLVAQVARGFSRSVDEVD